MKIFGIGLSKTGTTSLTVALGLLGYRAVHCPYLLRIDDVMAENDAATDTPIALAYQMLDYRYPGSKFILTHRNGVKWLQSMNTFMPDIPRADWLDFIHYWLYGGVSFDSDRLVKSYGRHRHQVQSYFAGRPDQFLELNICAGEGWQTLCPFLGKPIPNVPFPHIKSS